MTHEFAAGDRVEKVGGDYSFAGEVRAVVVKRSGRVRYVVEDDRGLLFIFSAANLRRPDAAELAQVESRPTPEVR